MDIYSNHALQYQSMLGANAGFNSDAGQQAQPNSSESLTDPLMSSGLQNYPEAFPQSNVGQFIGSHEASERDDSLSKVDSNDVVGSEGKKSPVGEDKNDTPPAWSELKTKAGKDRKRLPLACIACRRKKIRCSGEKPACKHCMRSRIPCVYKVSTRKAAPRTDYMGMLDKRLKRMEERVIKVLPKDEAERVAAVARAVLKPAVVTAPPKGVAANKKRQAEEAFGGDSLDTWAADKQGDPTKSGQQPISQEADEHQLLTEGASALPSKEIQEHLAEVYFDYAYGQSYHLLHKPSYMRKLRAGSLPPVLVLAVCACAARFSTHPEVRSEPAFLRGEQWASVARDISLRRYDNSNITILIVYLILGLHEFGTCQGGRSWMFCGMAQRMAYALQLHRDLTHDPLSKGEKEFSCVDQEIRRRTMWACFIMDRFNSSGTDRPMLVREEYCPVRLPAKEQYFQMEISAPTEYLCPAMLARSANADEALLENARENLGVAAHQIRLVGIWGMLIDYINLGGKEKDKNPMWSTESELSQIKALLQETWDSFPESIQYNEENLQNYASEHLANQFLFLHITYNQILLFMNRWALPGGTPNGPPKNVPEAYVAESSRTALDAANKITTLIKEASHHRVVAPFAGYSAFLSSTVHILGVFSKRPELQAVAKANLTTNVKFLNQMKKYWGVFHFLAEHLKDLYRQHADAAHGKATENNEKSPDGSKGSGNNKIFQYGDWFDRYPHGVSQTDYEDPVTAGSKKEAGTDAVLGQKSELQSVEEFFASLSPPSSATLQKKVPKKRGGQSVGSKNNGTGHGSRRRASHPAVEAPPKLTVPTAQPGQQPQHPQSAVASDFVSSQNADFLTSPTYPGSMPFSAAAGSSFSPADNILMTPSSATHANFSPLSGQEPVNEMMNTLDQNQMLPSYAGNGGQPLQAAPQPQAASNTEIDPSVWAAFDFGAMGMADLSNSWFMPFNVDPPNGSFGGSAMGISAGPGNHMGGGITAGGSGGGVYDINQPFGLTGVENMTLSGDGLEGHHQQHGHPNGSGNGGVAVLDGMGTTDGDFDMNLNGMQ